MEKHRQPRNPESGKPGPSGLDKALLEFRRTMNESLIEEAERSGCSLSHLEVMKYVAEKEDPSMKDIAAHLRITPPSTSVLIDILVAKKLVIRKQAASDRRTVRIHLAPKAFKLFASLHKQKASVFEKMLSKLSPEDKDLLAGILTKCIS
ncbi:MAG: hypothetical protein JWO73_670 [Candidatus Taylorbacteria bacterium]|nr:hypothetical protein [Candidatus Taylorbacteria bacterium]